MQFLGFDPDALLKELATGKGDGEMLEWVQAHSKTPRSPWEIEAWSAFMEKRAPDSDAETLAFFAETWAGFPKPGKTSKPGSNSANSMTMSALEEKRKFTLSKTTNKKKEKTYEQ